MAQTRHSSPWQLRIFQTFGEKTCLRSHDWLRKGLCAGPEFYVQAFKTRTHQVKENDTDVKI